MKTLLIHPADPTTDFIKDFYADNIDWTIVNDLPSKSKLKKLVKSHDTIIVIGHGTDNG